MSKTDATTPYRVILFRDGVETHDHLNRECDFDKFDPVHPWKTLCGYRIPNQTWRQSLKHFGKPRHAHGIENMLERRDRRAWKRALASEDFDNINIGRLDSAWLIY